MINTNCAECIFSNKIYSDTPCLFNIVDHIKDHKNITIKDGYFYIENYQCKYCFSKNIEQQYKDKIDSLNLIEQIKQRNLISYTLVVDLKNAEICELAIEKINQLAIKPKYLILLFYSQRMQKNIDAIKSKLDKNIKWKIHNFLEPDFAGEEALKVATDTNQDVADIPFLWIENAENINYIVDNNVVEKINYIVNVEQPVCNFIRSKLNTGNNFHNMFMNYSTYKHITTNINSSLQEGIKQLENVTTIYYD